MSNSKGGCLVVGRNDPRRNRAARLRRGEPAMMEMLEARLLLSAATKLAFGVEPGNGTVDVALPSAVTVDVEDAGGAIVTTDHSKVTIEIATGPTGGHILGRLTVNAVSGVATFNRLLFSKAGNYTVKVVDGALTLATSTSFAIAGQPQASQLVFTTEPTGNVAGAKLGSNVVVTVKDQFGNVFTQGSETVSLSVFSGTGKLLGVTHETTVNGVATFSGLSMSAAGSYVLRASAKGVTADSTSFSVTAPAVATSLAFVQEPAATATAGMAMGSDVTVKVLDQYGHTVTDNHSIVRLNIHTGPTTKGTFMASVHNGVATFTGLKFDKSGTYTLIASDGSLTTANSTSFQVNAASAVRLAVESVPVNGSAHAGPFTVKADVLDIFGNVVTGSNANITLSYASAPHGVAPLSRVVAAVSGVATFSNLSFPTAGRYALRVSGAIAGSDSKGFILA